MIYIEPTYSGSDLPMKEAIATVSDELWEFYKDKPHGVYWDVVDGEFVQLIPIDEATTMFEASKRIPELKQLLADSDYKAIKFAEGELSAEEYATTKAQRAAWRAEINALQEQYPNL